MPNKIKLLDVVILEPRVLKKISKNLWMLEKPWHFDLFTNEFRIMVRNQPGWITDKRSGTDAINCIVPKDGNDIYNAVIGFHDTAWSGWLTRALSNEIMAQGMVFSKEVSVPVSRISKFMVDNFGHYYQFDDELPPPYTNSRKLELIRLVAK